MFSLCFCRWVYGQIPLLSCGETAQALPRGSVPATLLPDLLTGHQRHLVTARDTRAPTNRRTALIVSRNTPYCSIVQTKRTPGVYGLKDIWTTLHWRLSLNHQKSKEKITWWDSKLLSSPAFSANLIWSCPESDIICVLI